MLQYLVIILDDTSASYCHYSVSTCKRRLMTLEILRRCILFGMKENLYVQFVLPEYKLPEEYWREMNTIDHTLIMSSKCDIGNAMPDNDYYRYQDVIVFDGINELSQCVLRQDQTYVLRVCKDDLFQKYASITQYFGQIIRLNIVLTDLESFTEKDFSYYKIVLECFANALENIYLNGKSPQVNIITDRIMVKSMNNCGAGDTSIAIAPDGNIYPCPAFYQNHHNDNTDFRIGNIMDGLNAKNGQLYKIDYAPLCRICDAFHCKRCIWLNKKLTREVNIPSHQQCVVAHLERNTSKILLDKIRKRTEFMKGIHIKEISYLDPFEVKPEL